MYVCLCFGVTDTQVRDAIRKGGARSLADLGRMTGAGVGCEGCHDLLSHMLRKYRPRQEEDGDGARSSRGFPAV